MKRDHRNVGPSSSTHNICFKKVGDELPIPSLNVCFAIFCGRSPCSHCDSSLVIEERGKIVRDLGLLLPRNSGSAKHLAAPAVLSGPRRSKLASAALRLLLVVSRLWMVCS